jgi:probable HAF family extracellular repeat protein
MVAGSSGTITGSTHAFLYTGSGSADLGTLGGWSFAYGVNDSLQVVGYSQTAAGPEHAFFWWFGGMLDLGTLPGGTNSYAYGVNNSGEVVGASNTGNGNSHAFFFNGTMHDLGTLPGGTWSSADCINDLGWVAGHGDDAGGDLHAFVWSGSALVDLGTPAGFVSEPHGINLAGDIVGAMGQESPADGFLYHQGELLDLTGLLDPADSAWQITAGAGINDSGQIAACGFSAAALFGHALRLTPEAGVAGTVALQNFAGDATQVPITVEVRTPGTTTVLQTQTVNLDAAGVFWFACGLTGTYDVAVKAPHWLRKTIPDVSLPIGGYASTLSFSLTNGDVNGDNAVDLADLVAISAAWRSTPGSLTWNQNADLNGDGTVNLADWLIVARNYRKSGAP